MRYLPTPWSDVQYQHYHVWSVTTMDDLWLPWISVKHYIPHHSYTHWPQIIPTECQLNVRPKETENHGVSTTTATIENGICIFSLHFWFHSVIRIIRVFIFCIFPYDHVKFCSLWMDYRSIWVTFIKTWKYYLISPVQKNLPKVENMYVRFYMRPQTVFQ